MSPEKVLRRKAAEHPELHSDVELGANSLIAAKLRKLFDEVAQQPIPDRFVELLRELESKDAGQTTAKKSKSD